MGATRDFVRHHYRHFNAAALRDAAEAYVAHIDAGGHMLLTMGGAMSTAEMGLSVARLIREGRVHALCVTGANLEEDLFNLVAHDSYERLPHYRSLTAADEVALHARGMNRVTDTCIPEDVAIRRIEKVILARWQAAERARTPRFPHEFLYQILRSGELADSYQIDPADSWLAAAAERDLPIWTPGWEDSTLGNIFVAHGLMGDLEGTGAVRGGLEAMRSLVAWYTETDRAHRLGFFQIAGGIAGDFPICAVPLIRQDLGRDCRLWGYFCQISDSTTSFGSYSGAVPNEKITWGKLDADSPRFVVESDATIVFPLIAAHVLDR